VAQRRRDENLRQEILNAAERLLGEGPQAITSRAVQQAAGVSSGTFFHYFRTVDDLLLALALRAADRQPESFGDPMADGVDHVLARLFDPARRDTVLPWLRQRAVTSPQLQEALTRYDVAVSGQFAAGVRAALADSGALDGVDVEATVDVVRALAEGFQLRVSSKTLTVEPERFARAAIDLITRGVVSAAR
jgi:AcrR family transcriptional regulator